jgi:hypothetical protein
VREPRLLNQQWQPHYSARRVTPRSSDCQEHRGFVIPQQLAVICALLALENHPYAEDIHSAVRKTTRRDLWTSVHTSLKEFPTRGRAGGFADDGGPKNQG